MGTGSCGTAQVPVPTTTANDYSLSQRLGLHRADGVSILAALIACSGLGGID